MSQLFTPKPIQYDRPTLERAKVAFLCSPFQWSLLESMRDRRVSLGAIAGPAGVEAGFTEKALPETTADHHMMWLMRVGLFRREVDGQGLTDSFRLTPLGRQTLEAWQQQENIPKISPIRYVSNHLRCWLSRFSL